MQYKTLYKKDEWNTLLNSVMWIFSAVAGADGFIDKKEHTALKQICAKASDFDNNLATELLHEINNNIAGIMRQSLTDGRGFQNGLADTVKLLNTKFPKNVSIAFRKILLAIGFYIGNVSEDSQGTKISPEELKVISSLAGVLQLSKEEMNATPTVADYMALIGKQNEEEQRQAAAPAPKPATTSADDDDYV